MQGTTEALLAGQSMAEQVSVDLKKIEKIKIKQTEHGSFEQDRTRKCKRGIKEVEYEK